MDAPQTAVVPATAQRSLTRTQRASGARAELGRGVEQRMLDAVTRAGAEEGFNALTVEAVLSAAAVSRTSFYQHFANVEECFWCAHHRHAQQLVDRAERAARSAAEPQLAVLDVLAETAAASPDTARMLFAESLGAGPRGIAERDRLLSALSAAMTSRETATTIDLPLATVVGGAMGYLAMRLGEPNAPGALGEELRQWTAAFSRPSGTRGWTDRLTPDEPDDRMQSPSAPPQGSRRERIVAATSIVIHERGYRALTVSDIVAAAGVSRRSFYDEFAGKQAAFIAAYEQGFQRTLEHCTPVFFSPGSWPQRVWASAQAFTGFFAAEPLIAHLGFVEAYSVGRFYRERAYDMQLAFTLFLEEGFRQRPEAEALDRSCAALTAAAIFELAFQGSRRGPGDHLRRLQPLAVYIALAPFIGRDAAGMFVEGKLAEGREDALAVA